MNLIKVLNGIATREPVPDFLMVLPAESLADLSWLPSVYGLTGCVWWPEESTIPPLTKYQSYGEEVLVPDAARQVVVSSRSVRDWTAEEILAYKASMPRRISRLAFRNRLTLAEKIAFEMAQLDNPSTSTTAREASAALRILDKDLSASQYIDLNSAVTQGAVQQLEALGIIAAGRADDIIWGDIQPVEVP